MRRIVLNQALLFILEIRLRSIVDIIRWTANGFFNNPTGQDKPKQLQSINIYILCVFISKSSPLSHES